MKTYHVAIDAYRLLTETHTSGAAFVSELTRALATVPEVATITLLLPAPPPQTGAVHDLLSLEGVRHACPEIPQHPELSFRSQLQWVQRTIPALVRSLPKKADLFVSAYHHPPMALRGSTEIATVVHDLCGLGPGYPKYKKGFYKHLTMLLLTALSSHHIVTISRATRQNFATTFPRAKHKLTPVVYNHVQRRTVPGEIRQEALVRFGLRSRSYFMAFGAPGLRKGTDILLESYAEYKRGNGTSRLLVVANRSYASTLLELARNRNLDDILVLSEISDEERDSLYQGAVALLFTSRCEGFGYPLVEAMHQGCPSIAWAQTPAREILGDSPYLVGSLRADEIAKKMHAIEHRTTDERLAEGSALIERAYRFSSNDYGRRFMAAICGKQRL